MKISQSGHWVVDPSFPFWDRLLSRICLVTCLVIGQWWWQCLPQHRAQLDCISHRIDFSESCVSEDGGNPDMFAEERAKLWSKSQHIAEMTEVAKCLKTHMKLLTPSWVPKHFMETQVTKTKSQWFWILGQSLSFSENSSIPVSKSNITLFTVDTESILRVTTCW